MKGLQGVSPFLVYLSPPLLNIFYPPLRLTNATSLVMQLITKLTDQFVKIRLKKKKNFGSNQKKSHPASTYMRRVAEISTSAC